MAQLERSTLAPEADSQSVVSGLIGSCECNSFHLQSFLLYANKALLQHPAWLRFWLHYAIDSSKDGLINKDETGFTQAFLAARLELRLAHALVEGLRNDPSIAADLKL